MLWWIYCLINMALIFFIVIFFYHFNPLLHLLPVGMVLAGIVLFGRFCYKCYKDRLRRKVDEPLKMSLLSIFMMVIPIVFLLNIIIWVLFSVKNPSIILTYGFCIFFGWITAIIFGMTFKTLPFILWNKTYHKKAGMGKTPNPKDLFSITVFITGILFHSGMILKLASFLLILTAFLYNTNVFKMIFHKPQKA